LSAVRAIDSNVVSLIALASGLGDTGTNNTGGGVINFIPLQNVGANNPAYVQVLLRPPAAVAAGAGWRLHGDASFGSVPAYTRAITTNGASIEFAAVPGWNPPAAQSVSLAAGAITVISDAPYTVGPPVLTILPGAGLGMTGTTGTVYRLEWRTSLVAGAWLPLGTNAPLSNGFNLLLSWPLTNGPSSYYRSL